MNRDRPSSPLSLAFNNFHNQRRRASLQHVFVGEQQGGQRPGGGQGPGAGQGDDPRLKQSSNRDKKQALVVKLKEVKEKQQLSTNSSNKNNKMNDAVVRMKPSITMFVQQQNKNHSSVEDKKKAAHHSIISSNTSYQEQQMQQQYTYKDYRNQDQLEKLQKAKLDLCSKINLSAEGRSCNYDASSISTTTTSATSHTSSHNNVVQQRMEKSLKVRPDPMIPRTYSTIKKDLIQLHRRNSLLTSIVTTTTDHQHHHKSIIIDRVKVGDVVTRSQQQSNHVINNGEEEGRGHVSSPLSRYKKSAYQSKRRHHRRRREKYDIRSKKENRSPSNHRSKGHKHQVEHGLLEKSDKEEDQEDDDNKDDIDHSGSDDEEQEEDNDSTTTSSDNSHDDDSTRNGTLYYKESISKPTSYDPSNISVATSIMMKNMNYYDCNHQKVSYTKDYIKLAHEYKKMSCYQHDNPKLKKKCFVCKRKAQTKPPLTAESKTSSRGRSKLKKNKKHLHEPKLFLGKVLFPCQHRCICNECWDDHQYDRKWTKCPFCGEEIKFTVDYTSGTNENDYDYDDDGDGTRNITKEEEQYWNWINEVKPHLPNGFIKSFARNSRRAISEAMAKSVMDDDDDVENENSEDAALSSNTNVDDNNENVKKKTENNSPYTHSMKYDGKAHLLLLKENRRGQFHHNNKELTDSKICIIS